MSSAGNTRDFPVLEGISFRNANRVHPLMQKRAEKIIHSLELDCEIDIITNLRPEHKLYQEIEKGVNII